MPRLHGNDDGTHIPVQDWTQPVQQLHAKPPAAVMPDMPPGYDADEELAAGGTGQ